jgi:hypothetical protein
MSRRSLAILFSEYFFQNCLEYGVLGGFVSLRKPLFTYSESKQLELLPKEEISNGYFFAVFPNKIWRVPVRGIPERLSESEVKEWFCAMLLEGTF